MDNTMPLVGQVVAVSGASRGIGYAITEHLLAQGATVIAGARGIDTLIALQKHYPALQAKVLDVTDTHSVQVFAQHAIEAGVGALVNNAGIGIFGLTEDIQLADYHRVMNTNVLGTLLLSQAFIPHFKARGFSRVINVTSDVSDRTFAGGALYTASKFAQRALTRALAYEGQAYGLQMTEIRPGETATYFGQTQPDEPRKAHWLKPEDLARAVAYVLAQPAHMRTDEIVLHPSVQIVVF